VWIILMATLLSREHARRGERLEASEARLLASEARYRTLIESAPEAIVVLDVERECLVDVNQRACDLFGWSAAELTDLDPLALSPPAQPDGRRSRTAARPYFDQAVAGGSPVFEWVHRRRDGRDFPSEVRLVRLPDPVRALVRGTITDISERVQLQEQLRQAQKMEAIGQLAGGVAHDFNNLLTIISGYADLLHQQLDTADARRGLVEAIQEGSTRATWLTERLLAFSRRAALSPQTMDLNQVVLDTHAMLPPLTGKNIQLNVDLHEGRTRVRVDPGLWSQVLLNLVINARDAMPHGGRLDIATTAIDIDTSMATSDRPAGRYIQLSVTDSGDGMPPEVKSRVFEPFFTTKPVGKGTGLGLAVVHGIVRQAGGFIDVASTPGAGTTFVISVPAVQSDSHAGARDTSEPVSITPVGAGHRAPDRGTILLIENSDAVRQLIETTLHSQGFKVLVAHDEHDALRLLDAHDGAVDLLIKALEKNVEHRGDAGDSVLAGSRHSALTALYISDDVVTAPSPAEPTNGRHAFLQRPFSLDTLTHTVRELLTGRSEGRLDRGSR
jgi:PAS domain S-box-containing protein